MSPFRDLTYAGYGLVFISHEVDKVYKNDKGEEYNKIIPALPNRPFNLINKMVDIIGYIREVPEEENGERVSKRYMFFRSDERFLTKSRFKYIVPYIELSYDAYVKAIYDAIDKQIAEEGGESTDSQNPFVVRDFDELMSEAKELWSQLNAKELTGEALKILEKEFGRPIRFSEILPEQKDQFQKALFEIKSLID